MELSGSPLFVIPVFSGSRQLNSILDAKTRKFKSLRKESDKAKIILLSFIHLVRDLIQLRTPRKGRLFQRRKFGDRRQSAPPNCSHEAASFLQKVAQGSAETESERWKFD